jgi:hypothetical protein
VRAAFVIFGTEPRHWNAGLEVAVREVPNLESLKIIWAAGGTPYIPFYSIGGMSQRILFRKVPSSLTDMASAIEKQYPLVKVEIQMLTIKTNPKTKKLIKNFLRNNSELEKLTKLKPMMSAAITNALIYETRNKWASMKSHGKLVNLLCNSYYCTYEKLIDVIREGRYQKVIFFNGRFIHEKALWAVSEELGVQKIIFECLRERYILFDHGPHERFSIQARMKNIWDEALRNKGKEAVEIASQYFDSLTQSQINRFVPDTKEILEEQFDFSFFTNSDDEAIGLGKDWVSPLGDNYQITKDVIKLFESGKFGTLAIKIHPNVANKAKEEIIIWSELTGNKFVRIFDVNSKISSSQLVQNSKVVITTGSTVGAEAIFRLKPVAVLAPARFDQLGCTANISSINELGNWCESLSISGMSSSQLEENRLKILALGYWMAVSGKKHELLEIQAGNSGGYLGKSFLGVPNKYPTLLKLTDRLIWNLYFLGIGMRLQIWKR